jgi:hypothetical protein
MQALKHYSIRVNRLLAWMTKDSDHAELSSAVLLLVHFFTKSVLLQDPCNCRRLAISRAVLYGYHGRSSLVALDLVRLQRMQVKGMINDHSTKIDPPPC